MKSRQQELAELILDQNRERRQRGYQPPERGTVPLGPHEPFLTSDGFRPRTHRVSGSGPDAKDAWEGDDGNTGHPRTFWPTCPLHGRDHMRAYNTRPGHYCAQCNRISWATWKAKHPGAAAEAQRARYWADAEQAKARKRELYAQKTPEERRSRGRTFTPEQRERRRARRQAVREAQRQAGLQRKAQREGPPPAGANRGESDKT